MARCENCQRDFESRRGLSIHLAKCQSSNVVTAFCCQFCGRCVTTKRGLQKHEIICRDGHQKHEELKENECEKMREKIEALQAQIDSLTEENEELKRNQTHNYNVNQAIIISEKACNELDLTHLLTGPKGLARHCLQNMISGDIFKTDASRKVITYIPEGAKSAIKDPKGERLARTIHKKTKHRAEIIQEQINNFKGDPGCFDHSDMQHMRFCRLWNKEDDGAITAVGYAIASLAKVPPVQINAK